MKDLEYFIDVDNGFLLAYEGESEFFVRYLEASDEWEDCPITFSQLRHDYCFREAEREEVLRRTNGNLPEALYRQYSDLIGKGAEN